jgi:hypothetical protein
MSFTVVADVVLVVHFAVVLFVVGGMLAIALGVKLGWLWVHGWLFRLTHVATVALITLQAWLGQHCPLTTLEGWLRTQAGEQSFYEVSFVQYWLENIMYFQAPLWVFAIVYTLFGLLVILAWWRFPPKLLQSKNV